MSYLCILSATYENIKKHTKPDKYSRKYCLKDHASLSQLVAHNDQFTKKMHIKHEIFRQDDN